MGLPRRGVPMHKVKQFVIGIMVVFLSACSTGSSVQPIPLSEYTQSLYDFQRVEALQERQQTHFSVKILSFIKVIKEDMSYYAYDFIIAPKTTLAISTWSVSITPDYTVHDKLKAYFTDKSGRLWKIYPVRPEDIAKSFRRIKISELFKETYGALRIRGYLVDGGIANYEVLGISKDEMTLAMSRLKITLNTGSTQETFSFQLGTVMSTYAINAIPESVLLEQGVVFGIVHNNLMLRWGEYLGD